MTSLFLLPFAAAIVSISLAVAGVVRRRRSPAAWCFFAGMVLLGVKSAFVGLRLQAFPFDAAVSWVKREFLVESFLPVTWLLFSLTYSRTNYREFLSRWKLILIVAAFLPIVLLYNFDDLYRAIPAGTDGTQWALQINQIAKVLHVLLVISFAMILMNVEQTFRAAVGTMRWRIKLVVLAVGVIFGARLYIRVQAILFPGLSIVLWPVETGSLLIGCAFLVTAYLRTRLAEIDVYPSVAVLRSSLTILIVGVYLLAVGGLAQVARRFEFGTFFQWQAIVVLVGMAGLALLLLSDRTRQRIHVFVARHFSKAQHDASAIWTICSRQFSRVKDQSGVCEAAAKLISEAFGVLSVTVWLLDDDQERLVVRASTGRPSAASAGSSAPDTTSPLVLTGLQAMSTPFDLETASGRWADEVRELNSATFISGGNRLCVPLRSGERVLGLLVLADRINAAVYTVEELELLQCVADQMTSVLMNHRLASEVAQARELEAFRTMSLFFVHDLKNAAASLNLMLRNLPVHFNDPAFREDALRGIGNTARRIDEMIARLSSLRDQTRLAPTRADLNDIVSEALDRVGGVPNVHITRELHPLPGIIVDREQIQNVVTNLVLNARDAVGDDGRIQVHTEHRDGRVLLSVSDNGCGMDKAFVKDSLFRPFQSTKKKGLGIGLFQSRAIVQAHGGAIHVQTEAGQGTTFLISLPVPAEK
ncbi:MAG TPA: XrtA/PEP-CTERM system histidine kinase PrsK [Vicinamibacterales bacterium]|nr:XrtA/PEP-CTERM system histidine kinase PrsK [Vicinamibacterales bacterium]